MLEEAPGKAEGLTGPRRGGCRTSRGAVHMTTHSEPLQGSTGPASLSYAPLYRGTSSWLGTRYYPPVYPPCIPTRYAHPARTTLQTTRYTPGAHRSYSRFWTTVGEPRGMRTQPVLGSQDWLYTVFEGYEGLHGRLTGFTTVLTVFTEFRTCFTLFY